MRFRSIVAICTTLAPIGDVRAQLLPTFVTDSLAVVAIGGGAKGTPSALTGVSDALRQSDGSIVISTCSANDIRFFDAAGKHVTTVARKVAPLGALAFVRRVFPGGGESVGGFEAGVNGGRLFVLDANGALVQEARVPRELDVIGRLRDGTFVGRRLAPPPKDRGIHRRAITLYRIAPAGSITDSLTGLRGNETSVRAGQPSRLVRMARMGVVAVLPDRIAFGEQDSASYVEYGMDLQPIRSVATITKPEPITEESKRAWDLGQAVLIPRGGVAPAHAGDYATGMPAYRDMVAGIDGRVWVQDPSRPAVYPLVWTAYESTLPVAQVELPPRFFPTQFGTGWVLGVAFDAAGQEQVQVLRFVGGVLSGKKHSPRDAQPPDRPRCGPWLSR
jgi:hypothetical protein